MPCPSAIFTGQSVAVADVSRASSKPATAGIWPGGSWPMPSLVPRMEPTLGSASGWSLDSRVFSGGMAVPGSVADRLVGGLAGSCVLGLMFGLAAGLAYGFIKRPEPLRVEMQFRVTLVSFLRRFGTGFVIGVAVGLGIEPKSGADTRSHGRILIRAGLIVGAIAGCIFGGRAYGSVGRYTFAISGAIVGGLVFSEPDANPYTILGIAYGIIFGLGVAGVSVLSRAYGAYYYQSNLAGLTRAAAQQSDAIP
jgi:hypothetical protein